MVVGKGDERPDVVEERGIFEKLALPVAIIVQPDLLCRIKNLKCKPGHVPGMCLVDPAGPTQLEYTPLPRGERPEEGKVLHAGEIIHEKAVLQPAAGGGYRFEREFLHEGLEDHRPGDDDVSAFGIDPGYLLALFEREGTEQVDRFFEIPVREHTGRSTSFRMDCFLGNIGKVHDAPRAAHHEIDPLFFYLLDRVDDGIFHVLLDDLVLVRAHGSCGILGEEQVGEPDCTKPETFKHRKLLLAAK